MTRAAVACTILLLAGCSSSTIDSSDGTLPDAPTVHKIAYYLTGTAPSANLTLDLGSGSSQQQGVELPLTNSAGTRGLRFSADDGQFLYLSAQNQGDGTMTCRITEDGATVAENTSSGAYSIVTCEGSA